VSGDDAAAVIRDRTGAAQGVRAEVLRPFGGDRLVRRVFRNEFSERVIDEDGFLIAPEFPDALAVSVVLIGRGRLAVLNLR